MGLIAVGVSDFFLILRSCHVDQFMFHKLEKVAKVGNLRAVCTWDSDGKILTAVACAIR